jgi:hypothetical protein
VTDDLRATIRSQASPGATALLDQLAALGTPHNDERKTPRDVHDQQVATLHALAAAGLPRQDALRFALAAPWRPLVGPLFAALPLTRAERVLVLQAFVRPEDDQHYPVLDLSRQELDHVPPECADVVVTPANIGSDDQPVPYREINLGYNPLAALDGAALAALAAFEGVHLIAYKHATLPAELGAALPRLLLLNVSWGDLREFPAELAQATRLRSLRFNWTSVRELPETFATLTDLHTIEASETPLGEALIALADGADPTAPHLAAAARTRAMLDALGASIEL